MSNLVSMPLDFYTFLPDFKALFETAIADPKSIVVNINNDALYFQLLIVGLIHIYTYTNGVLFDWSGVDRLWSITPVIYANSFWIFKYLNTNTLDTRLFIMSQLITLWGMRLTYNFAIKGIYIFAFLFSFN